MNALACETGVAPSVLRGRVVGADDPTWLETDLEEVLGYRRERAKVCSGCGTQREQWYAADGKTLLNPPPFEAHPVKCEGCAALEEDRAEIPTNNGQTAPGYTVELFPFTPIDGDEG